jgi:hypothetical protein
LLAGRSGARMGGRSSGVRARSSYSSPSRSYRSSTTIIRPMIAPSPVIVSPGFGYSPFGYNPLGGFGTWCKRFFYSFFKIA